jgi:DNA-binding NarL/FixJ family response regulator
MVTMAAVIAVPALRAKIAQPLVIVAEPPSPRVPLHVRRGGSGAGLNEPVPTPPAVNGRRYVPRFESNPSAGRQEGGWAMPPTDWAGGSTSAWERAEGQHPSPDERLLIIDDCTLYRENLAAIFILNGMAAPSGAWDLPSLVLALEGTQPRVVLLNMATRGSHLLLRAAMDINPNMRVIVLGVSEDDESEIVACAEAGVAGYHMRTDSLEDLLALIHNVAAGESSCPPRVSAILLRRLSTLASEPQPVVRELALTVRETQILTMLELGRSNRDIAAQLRIAVHTVKNHVHSLLTKLGVSTRAEAAALSRSTRMDRGTHLRTRP